MSGNIRRPDFIIIGTMKGGTTALYDFITLHPKILKAKQKEIHYFSLYYERGVEWYLQHFSDQAGMITGEASTSYFHVTNNRLVPNLIKSFNPEIKLLLIVRDPIERAVSNYYHFCKVMKIPEVQSMDADEFFSIPFTEALRETSNIGFYLNQALSISLYYRSYLYYERVFDRNHLFVLTNHDLRMKPFETMNSVYKFLDVDPKSFDEFGEIRYSLGTNVSELSDETFNRLADLFYGDYQLFCEKTGIEYRELDRARPDVLNAKTSVESQESRVSAGSDVGQPKNEQGQEDVHVGTDGWLFLKKGTNSSIDYYQNPSLFDEEMTRNWTTLIRNRVQTMGEKGIRYMHLFVPNKLTIYPEYFGEDLPFYESSPLRKLIRSLFQHGESMILDHIVDPIEYFKRLKEYYQLYWKTDSHWTFYGVFGAYQLLCSKLGVAANASLLEREQRKANLILDEGGKLQPPVSEEATFFHLLKDAERIYANDLVKFKEENLLENGMGLHVGSNVVFQNMTAQNPERVILFGDSFSEYRPTLLTGALAETVRELHFVWSTSLDYSYIDRHKPDIVISETVERFMPRVPSDQFDLDTHIKMKLSEYSAL